jgi:hypothetical protein
MLNKRIKYSKLNKKKVCWYWKMMVEADQLWMAKCLRFGWNLNYIPNSFENGIWKQFYIENIKALQYIPIKVTQIRKRNFPINDKTKIKKTNKNRNQTRHCHLNEAR